MTKLRKLLNICMLGTFASLMAGDLQTRHILENELIYEYSDVQHSWESLRFLYKPSIIYDFNRKWSFRFQADIVYDGYYQLRDASFFTPEEKDQMETVFLLRDTMIKYKGGDYDVSFGKQLLSWGYTTGAFPVIDVANAQNRQSPFSQINNNPLSELMLKLDSYRFAGWTHSFFYLLDNQTDRIPVFESRFNGVPFPFEEAETEDIWDREPQFGYHGEYEFADNRQMAFTAMRILDNSGIFTQPEPEQLVIRHTPFQLLGFSYLQEVSQGQVKGEISYTMGREINILNDDVLSNIASDLAHFRLYYDNFMVPNATISMGVSHLQMLDFQVGSFLPEENQLFYVTFNRELIDFDSLLELNVQKSVGSSSAVGSDAETATLTYSYLGINNFQLNILARKVFRTGEDLPYENGFVFNAKYFF